MCYYAAPAWLGRHTRTMDIRKLNSLHYRLLRTALGDWKQTIGRNHLDMLGRVRPTTWAKYITGSTVIKILRDNEPIRLREHLLQTLYRESRSERTKFFDKSRLISGRQAIGNRLKHIFDEIETPILFTESNDSIRTLLKRNLGFPKNKAAVSSILQAHQQRRKADWIARKGQHPAQPQMQTANLELQENMTTDENLINDR